MDDCRWRAWHTAGALAHIAHGVCARARVLQAVSRVPSRARRAYAAVGAASEEDVALAAARADAASDGFAAAAIGITDTAGVTAAGPAAAGTATVTGTANAGTAVAGTADAGTADAGTVALTVAGNAAGTVAFTAAVFSAEVVAAAGELSEGGSMLAPQRSCQVRTDCSRRDAFAAASSRSARIFPLTASASNRCASFTHGEHVSAVGNCCEEDAASTARSAI